MNLKSKIRGEFYKGDLDRPIAETVGELINLLLELPEDLPIDPWDGGVAVIVYNVSSDAHLGFEKGRYYMEDDDYDEDF